MIRVVTVAGTQSALKDRCEKARKGTDDAKMRTRSGGRFNLRELLNRHAFGPLPTRGECDTGMGMGMRRGAGWDGRLNSDMLTGEERVDLREELEIRREPGGRERSVSEGRPGIT